MEIKIEETYHSFGENSRHHLSLLWRKDDEDYFSPKLRVRIKDNNNSPGDKFHRFLFPFSSKFSDLNFTSCVLYIYLCYVTCHTQWAWVTCGYIRKLFMVKWTYCLPPKQPSIGFGLHQLALCQVYHKPNKVCCIAVNDPFTKLPSPRVHLTLL